MNRIKRKLLAAAEENGWDIQVTMKMSGWLVTVPGRATEEAVRAWAKENDAQLYYRWKIEPPQAPNYGGLYYEGSDERGIGTGNE